MGTVGLYGCARESWMALVAEGMGGEHLQQPSEQLRVSPG